MATISEATRQLSLLLRQRDIQITLCGLLLISALAWLALLHMMGGQMAAMPGDMSAMAMTLQAWNLNTALWMLAMWQIMMLAMMLPSAIPMILLYQQVRRQQNSASHSETVIFAMSYLVLWSAFSFAATLLQWLLEHAAILSPMLRIHSAKLGGSTLIIAGLYQVSPLKHRCLTHCRSPLHFILHHWHAGTRGAWRMGWRHGLYCLGCCWALMSLLFVFGIMNFFWIALLSTLILLEKLLPLGGWLARVSGIALLIWGLRLLLT